MDRTDNRNEMRKRLVERWHDYGRQFTVFVPEEQPAPTIWEPDLPPPTKRRAEHPDTLKHWEYLFPTKEFLRQRYSKHGILNTPSLWFDCLVSKFKPPFPKEPDDGRTGEVPDQPDPSEWYEKALRIGIFHWQVGFSCRSLRCPRDKCRLHQKNPNRINPADIYSLLQEFEGFNAGTALSEVGTWFRKKLQPFDYKGKEKNRIPRYKVPKQSIDQLLKRYSAMRRQHVEPFIRETQQLISRCSVVDWHPKLFDADFTHFSKKIIGNLSEIGSPAAKAYLWLLVHQEEEASHRSFRISVSNARLAKELGVSRPTARDYRIDLEKAGLVECEGGEIIKVKYS